MLNVRISSETMSQRRVSVSYKKWDGKSGVDQSVSCNAGKSGRCRFYGMGSDFGYHGVEKSSESVMDVRRINARILVLKLLVCKILVTVVSAYAARTRLWEDMKYILLDDLSQVLSVFSDRKCDGVLNVGCRGHTGKQGLVSEVVCGGQDFGDRNAGDEQILMVK